MPNPHRWDQGNCLKHCNENKQNHGCALYTKQGDSCHKATCNCNYKCQSQLKKLQETTTKTTTTVTATTATNTKITTTVTAATATNTTVFTATTIAATSGAAGGSATGPGGSTVAGGIGSTAGGGGGIVTTSPAASASVAVTAPTGSGNSDMPTTTALAASSSVLGPSSGPAACTDENVKCARYGAQGKCKKPTSGGIDTYFFMQKYCQRTCLVCQPATSSARPDMDGGKFGSTDTTAAAATTTVTEVPVTTTTTSTTTTPVTSTTTTTPATTAPTTPPSKAEGDASLPHTGTKAQGNQSGPVGLDQAWGGNQTSAPETGRAAGGTGTRGAGTEDPAASSNSEESGDDSATYVIVAVVVVLLLCSIVGFFALMKRRADAEAEQKKRGNVAPDSQVNTHRDNSYEVAASDPSRPGLNNPEYDTVGAQSKAMRGVDSLFSGGTQPAITKNIKTRSTTTVLNAMYTGVEPDADQGNNAYEVAGSGGDLSGRMRKATYAGELTPASFKTGERYDGDLTRPTSHGYNDASQVGTGYSEYNTVHDAPDYAQVDNYAAPPVNEDDDAALYAEPQVNNKLPGGYEEPVVGGSQRLVQQPSYQGVQASDAIPSAMYQHVDPYNDPVVLNGNTGVPVYSVPDKLISNTNITAPNGYAVPQDSTHDGTLDGTHDSIDTNVVQPVEYAAVSDGTRDLPFEAALSTCRVYTTCCGCVYGLAVCFCLALGNVL